MKYYLRVLLLVGLAAVWTGVELGPGSSDAFAQGRGGGRGRGGRGGGLQLFQQGPGAEGGGEQAQPGGNNPGGNQGGSIFGGGNRRNRGQRGRGENNQGEGEQQPNITRGPGGRGGPRGGAPQLTTAQPPVDPQTLARQTFDRLDQNKDGMLQQDEARSLGGMRATADTDRNGVITLAELEASFANPGATQPGGPGGRRGGPRGEERNSSENSGSSQEERGRRGGERNNNERNNNDDNNSSRNQGGGENNQQQRNQQAARQNADKKDGQMAKTLMSTMTEKSYRFKPSKDSLPGDLPAWFTAMLSKDANRDGQVDMREYSNSWTEATLREFNSRDADGDGIITSDDALKKK